MSTILPSAADLLPFLPEILLIAGIVAVLGIPLFSPKKSILPVASAAVVAFALAFLGNLLTHQIAWNGATYFGGMLLLDPFAWAVKLILLMFSLIVMALWITDSHDKFIARGQAGDAAEFFVLLLSATLGLLLMTETGNLLGIFVALELASLPSYVLAGFRKGHRVGAEASLKYVLFGAAAAALMLYGMSLLYGLFGTLDIGTIGTAVANTPRYLSGPSALSFALGIAGLVVGIGFKIALVPVHFWCPDVFEGAPIDVTTFLAVASKAAGLALLARVVILLTGTWGGALFPGQPREALALMLLILGTVTCFWGNLAAFTQQNIKRLLAWSSIAHAGYMLIGMAAIVGVPTLTGDASLLASPTADVLLFYLFMYLFMNAGAFIAAAAIAQRLTGPNDAGMSLGVERMLPPPTTDANSHLPTTGEELRHYAGLSRRAPLLAATMLVFLLSLTGIPLTIGFGTKIKLFTILFGTHHWIGIAGLIAIGINTVLGAFYYFRVIRQMYLVDSDAPRLIEIAPVSIVALALVIPNILLFIGYNWVDRASTYYARVRIASELTETRSHEEVKTTKSDAENAPSSASVR